VLLKWDCILRIKSSDLSSFKIEYNSALLDGQSLDAKTSIWIWILGPYGLSLLGRKNSRQQISVICCWGHTFKILKHISVIYEAIVTRIYKILGSLYDCNIPPPKKIKAFYSKASLVFAAYCSCFFCNINWNLCISWVESGVLVNRLAQPPPLPWLWVPQCSTRLSYSIEEIQSIFSASHHFIHHSSGRWKVLRSGHGKSRMSVMRIVGSSDRLRRKAESVVEGTRWQERTKQ
jgi:hypothetical protein